MKTFHSPTRWNLNNLLHGLDMDRWDQQLNVLGESLKAFPRQKSPANRISFAFPTSSNTLIQPNPFITA
ncbi:hypothetical protein [Rossellomorea marisflavi]|uniref:Uncharacterized protein n=1 Tax=Rossellomorea marisflavi TaxID=189381 RepID=A0A165L4Z2_9BACI|nr:hypothetical protein [Rossellomorea marisflavi]KZE51029.1 hypothetical protein AV649_16815 [Rossellomorea marisflavi]